MGKILCLIFLFSGFTLMAQEKIIFRISVENTQSHVQTLAVKEFAQLIEAELGDLIDVEFFHSAVLFRDSHVISALARGSVEMAVPGTWQIGKYVPDIDVLLLPSFFGADSQDNDQFLTTPRGQELLSKLENQLQVVIPGRWLDLGPAHLFTTSKKVQSFSDFQGLNIRVPGGRANEMRLQALGGDTVIIPWPDLPPRIRDGSVAGVLTTFESVRSATLWKYGIKYAFLDHEYFPQYVPMISRSFWNKLSKAQQIIFRRIWEEIVVKQRLGAAAAQAEARRVAEENGVVVVSPDSEELMNVKKELLMVEEDISKALNIQPIYKGEK